MRVLGFFKALAIAVIAFCLAAIPNMIYNFTVIYQMIAPQTLFEYIAVPYYSLIGVSFPGMRVSGAYQVFMILFLAVISYLLIEKKNASTFQTI